MTPNLRCGSPSGDATLAIQRLARQTGADVQELQTLYVLEAFLARVAASGYHDQVVLKGGVLLAAFGVRRPTRDIDLQARGVANDAASVEELVRGIATVEVEDGVAFDLPSIATATIRDTDEYPGIRAKLTGALGRARLSIGVDVNFGDPISLGPSLVTVPPLVQLGRPPVAVLGYPLTMVLAEKIVTALDRGVANTRWRDFADIYTLAGVHPLKAQELRASLAAVAAYRQVELRPLKTVLASMPTREQPKWLAWRRRVHREHELPQEFAEVVQAVSQFADPVLNAEAIWEFWRPHSRIWQS